MTFKMRWNPAFIDAAMKAKCRIINYPSALEDANLVIGRAGCDKKKMRAETLDKFMPALLEAQKVPVPEGELPEVMAIVSWDDGMYLVVLSEGARLILIVIFRRNGVATRRTRRDRGGCR